ncbi:MAG: Flp family type IVb pilin [Clostridiaceae bacterium]
MLNKFRNYVVSILKQEKGQGMVEYALIIGLVAVVVIAVLVLLGPAISAKFQEIINAL